MQSISIIADNIFSPLGKTTIENFEQLKQNNSGIQLHHKKELSPESFYSSMFQQTDLKNNFTKFEQIIISSIENTIQDCEISLRDKKTILILSTTKGNIDLLNENNSKEIKDRIALHTSAQLIAKYFGLINEPIVISNACISGIVAILTAMRLLQFGEYETAIVTGADIVSRFVLSGFQSFQAISNEPCKPFDKERNGLTLGEAAATIILSSNRKDKDSFKVLSGSITNDANHISAPSRTGKELSDAINKTLRASNTTSKEIDFVSGHGTATLYNDEMEAKAIALSKLEATPINSLKGFYGHTLGAAGIVESVITLQSMRENLIIPTKGFDEIGVSEKINVCKDFQKTNLNKCLKIASGFSGCNAAILFSN